ncbi:uncharacterized protein [Amphiura filiformis]|uniref:uncharacterized protein n=1 Tax=Amphiura filiformis TaxID=82378 RepID=UPI003B21C0E8
MGSLCCCLRSAGDKSVVSYHNMGDENGQRGDQKKIIKSEIPNENVNTSLPSTDHNLNSQDHHLPKTARDDKPVIQPNGYDNAELTPDQDPDPTTRNDKPSQPTHGYDNVDLHVVPDQIQVDLRSEDDCETKPFNEFGNEGTGDGEFQTAKSLAVSADGDIVVVEHRLGRVYMFDKAYDYQVAMKFDETKKETKHLYPTDVAFTSPKHVAVVDQTRFVKIFDKEGAFLYSFNIKGGTDSHEDRPKAYSIEVALDGQILVGDVRRKVITIHKELDSTWEWVGKVNLNIEPHFLAVGNFQNGRQNDHQNGRHHVLVCDWKAGLVTAVDLAIEDSADNTIFHIDSFMVDGHPGLPKGVAYDDDNHFFCCCFKT